MRTEIITSWDKLPWSWLDTYQDFFLTKLYIGNWFTYLSDGDLFNLTLYNAADEIESMYPIVEYRERILGKRIHLWRCIGWDGAWYAKSFLPCDGQTAQNFLRFLAKERDKFDGVLVCCPDDILPVVQAIIGDSGFSIIEQRKQIFPYIKIDASWDDYWKTIKKSRQEDITQYLRKIEKRGRVSYRKISKPDECQEILDRFIETHRRRWSSKGQKSKYTYQKKSRDFLRALVSSLQLEGKLFLPCLSLNETVVAMAICIQEHGKIYYLSPTFDVDYRDLAPGKLLLYHLVREAFAEGYEEVDLGPGGDGYKFWWANGERYGVKFTLSHGNWLIWYKYWAIPELKRRVKRLLPPTGILI